MFFPLLQVFLDLGEQHLVVSECVKQGKLLGRGGFGFVFQGSVKHRVSGEPLDVALKMLQPVDPGHTARQSAIQAYKVRGDQHAQDFNPLLHDYFFRRFLRYSLR